MLTYFLAGIAATIILFGLIYFVRRVLVPREDTSDSLIMAAIGTGAAMSVCLFLSLMFTALAWVWQVAL